MGEPKVEVGGRAILATGFGLANVRVVDKRVIVEYKIEYGGVREWVNEHRLRPTGALAHESAGCGHARANWKDPKWGTTEYTGEERCEFCYALALSSQEGPS